MKTKWQKEIQDADPISSIIIAAMNKIREHKYVPRETMGDFTASELRARIPKQAFPSLLQSAEDERRKELNNESYDLRDDGRSDGYGESYAERNL